jgi:hypothetical protein
MVFLNFIWNLNLAAHLKFVPGFPPGEEIVVIPKLLMELSFFAEVQLGTV